MSLPVDRLRRRGLLATAAWLAAGTAAADAARFPERPLTLVVPFAPGGVADLTARAVAESLARVLAQPVVVENKPSAGGIVGTQAVVSARPDGHTLLLLSNANAVSATLFRRLPFDVQRDLAPVSLLARFDLGLFVAAGSRHRTLAELLADARARPGRINAGTIAVGSTQQLAAKLFETRAGVELLVVPYKGSPAVLAALRSGEIDLAFEIVAPMLPQLQAGVVRALAVTSAERHPLLPEVPTVQQAGVAGYDVTSWNALAAPAGTPPAVLQRLQQAVQLSLAAPALQQTLARLGVRVGGSSADALAALLAGETARWGEVIRRAGIEPQ